jgi:ferredoxin-thioredoxin reductase catalytic subunit
MNDSHGVDSNETGRLTPERIDALYKRLHAEAEAAGYHLNPDVAFTKDLVRSLLVNEERYGYWACPCRLADGDRDADRDIICPCDYRDADLDEYDMCYCALYVSDRVLTGEVKTGPIPERRPVPEESEDEDAARPAERVTAGPARPAGGLSQPVWRCRVCGYLCAREKPPLVCPICKAKQDRFERFM